jgi:HprK-related kinase A
LNVSDLTSKELRIRLRNPGIFLQTSTFITHLQTSIPSVAEGIELLYSDYPLADPFGFADFHIRLTAPFNLRRWFKPQVLFRSDGNSPFTPLPLGQAFPMFEWGLNWCVSSHANSYLIIHAAVVEKNGYAAVMPAPPGSGKSTLCAALVNRGWRLLSDELALIRVSDGKITPLPRPVSLKNQSIDIIRQYASAAVFSPKVSDTVKGTVAHMKPPSDSILRAAEIAQPAWIIFPKYQAGTVARLENLPQARAFMGVADNAFNYSLLGLKGFQVVAELINETTSYDFTYSILDDAIAIFDALEPPVIQT